MHPKSPASLCLVILAASIVAACADETLLQASRDEQGVLVSQGEQPVLFYQRETKSLDGAWPRAAYVHPLYDLKGKVITEDFPADHRHHRGLFWAWHQVWLGDKKLGDAWICKDFVWDVQSVEISPPGSQVSILANVHWKSSDHVDDANNLIPIVSERVKVTVHLSAPDHRLIDFEISLLALLEGVRIGGSEDAKGYGGFSPRIKLTPEQTFSSASGVIEPAKTAMDVGAWVNVAGNESGLVMIQHPSNPANAPAYTAGRWILRRSRSMQNAVYPGRQGVELSTKDPIVLRYRLVVHDGTLCRDKILLLQQQYEASTQQR